jgi:hypothetical protein
MWARTQGCAARHALVSRMACHDPLWSYIDVLSSRKPFSWLSFPILSKDPCPEPRCFFRQDLEP